MDIDEMQLRERLSRIFSLQVDSELLERALVHPSFANERRLSHHNQRLEFLGDAVLELCTSELLVERFPSADEGQLTRMRAQLVNTEALADWARDNGVAEALLLGRGAEAGGLRNSTNVLADCVEALIAASYLEAGMGAARRACGEIVGNALRQLSLRGGKDAKTELQERAQALGFSAPAYELIESSGPAHEPWFRVRVRVADRILAEGAGKSKRAAERAAAAIGLDHDVLRSEAEAVVVDPSAQPDSGDRSKP